MRVIEVHPYEERAASGSLQPAQRFVHYYVASSFYFVSMQFVQMAEIKVVEVSFKALVQPRAGIKHRGAEKGGRGIALVAQNFPECDGGQGNFVHGKVVNPRGHGKAAGKEGGVRGEGNRYWSVGVAEPRRRARQGINVGSLNFVIAITA